ncbi:hypothetical protein GCM10010319_36280 [Streptomyces blastmyceticus]|uniref:Uncharacterized protein n=1 Tax=Streptomyces blastmyceticus TaxID=68180 RepID=A0ABP3GVI9_9ACTN
MPSGCRVVGAGVSTADRPGESAATAGAAGAAKASRSAAATKDRRDVFRCGSDALLNMIDTVRTSVAGPSGRSPAQSERAAPPSMRMDSPLMYAAASETRKAASLPISATVA